MTSTPTAIDALSRLPLAVAIREAAWDAGAARRSREAVGGLFEASRSHSARLVVTGRLPAR